MSSRRSRALFAVREPPLCEADPRCGEGSRARPSLIATRYIKGGAVPAKPALGAAAPEFRTAMWLTAERASDRAPVGRRGSGRLSIRDATPCCGERFGGGGIRNGSPFIGRGACL